MSQIQPETTTQTWTTCNYHLADVHMQIQGQINSTKVTFNTCDLGFYLPYILCQVIVVQAIHTKYPIWYCHVCLHYCALVSVWLFQLWGAMPYWSYSPSHSTCTMGRFILFLATAKHHCEGGLGSSWILTSCHLHRKFLDFNIPSLAQKFLDFNVPSLAWEVLGF